jgi:hypothetical protein
MKTPNYCTLFDFNYLSRGLALYESLCAVHDEFCLYVVAFDEKTRFFLLDQNLKHAVIISLAEFEDEALLAVKPTRTRAEYCWTCTSSVIKYAIETYKLDSCTYLDADIFFYFSPSIVFDDLSSCAVGLSPHNYSPEYDLSLESGKYCVQFLFFRNNDLGMSSLQWWREECIKWCFAKVENGKYGDQKYLDSFSDRFQGICDIEHPGIGVAPWNILNHTFEIKDGAIRLTDKKSNDQPVIFYHFQNLKINFEEKRIVLGKWYDIKDDVFVLFYKPYIDTLLEYESLIKNTRYDFHEFNVVKESRFRLWIFFIAHRIFKGNKMIRTIYNKLSY